jgi:LPXTG-motif cell wall-anchored protein
MTRRRFAGATVVAFAILCLAPGIASAASPSPSPSGYQAANPSLTLSAATVDAGNAVTISGNGYTAGETIGIAVTYGPSPTALGSRAGGGGVALAAFALPQAQVTNTTANASGAFSHQVMLTQAGVATITATGATSGLVRTSTVSVRATAIVVQAPSAGSLPFTGTNLLILAALGVVVLAVGALLLVRRNRRSAGHTPAHAPAA